MQTSGNAAFQELGDFRVAFILAPEVAVMLSNGTNPIPKKPPALFLNTDTAHCVYTPICSRLLNSNSLTTIRDDAFSGLTHLEYL